VVNSCDGTMSKSQCKGCQFVEICMKKNASSALLDKETRIALHFGYLETSIHEQPIQHHCYRD